MEYMLLYIALEQAITPLYRGCLHFRDSIVFSLPLCKLT